MEGDLDSYDALYHEDVVYAVENNVFNHHAWRPGHDQRDAPVRGT